MSNLVWDELQLQSGAIVLATPHLLPTASVHELDSHVELMFSEINSPHYQRVDSKSGGR